MNIVGTKNACIECSTTLVLDKNWTQARAKQGKYLCKKCWHSRDMYVNGVYISKTHPLFKPGKYKTFSDAAFESAYKINHIKEGYVYAITNPAWTGWVKIGMALEASDRLNGYQTSSPYRDYVLEHSVASKDRRKSEQEAHTKALKLSEDSRGEWFKLTVQQAITILDNLDEQHRTPSKADTHPPKDNIQKRPIQADFWDIAEDFQSRQAH